MLKESRFLCEMAIPRKAYKERVKGLSNHVLENWRSVRYCSLTGQKHYKKHWSDELRGHLLSLYRISIKANDSAETILKMFEEDYNKPQPLTMTIATKFRRQRTLTAKTRKLSINN